MPENCGAGVGRPRVHRIGAYRGCALAQIVLQPFERHASTERCYRERHCDWYDVVESFEHDMFS